MIVERQALVARLGDEFDVLVIGGGATGLGAAVDAATRGYRTALVEASDFAKATSSRSTKLVHGGVRYLQNGDIGLVREALRERANMRRNAAHLVDRLGFICPVYRSVDVPYYLAGFKAYDLLAGGSNFEPSRYLGPAATLARLPDLKADGLRGGIRYSDGSFDDARLALALARTALDNDAVVVNYVRAVQFVYAGTQARGAIVRDEETGRELEIRAKVVINATGIFVDELRRLDEPSAQPLLSHSRGSHLVFAPGVFRGEDALLVPKTGDGRVLFAIPWHGRVIVGTTDVAVSGAELDAAPTREEADFIVAQLNAYLAKPVARKDAVAAFAGLRPLVSGKAASTAKLSREHLVDVSRSAVVTVTGGKWTTYRKMAADAVDAAQRAGRLVPASSRTATLSLHGNPGHDGHPSDVDYASYGTDRSELLALERADPALRQTLHARLPYTLAEVVFAARCELARTVDDVLARRTRSTFIDLAAARAAAPLVATLLSRELGHGAAWEREQLAAFERIVARDAAAFD